jgi:uncharacterized protein YjeT (DUF2065 family)
MGIGWGAELGGAPAENLCFALELGVNLQPDDGFEFHVAWFYTNLPCSSNLSSPLTKRPGNGYRALVRIDEITKNPQTWSGTAYPVRHDVAGSFSNSINNTRPTRPRVRVMKYFLCVIGMVMIIEGVPYFAFPEKMKTWIYKVLEIPEGTLRRFGFSLMLLGLLLVYFGRS